MQATIARTSPRSLWILHLLAGLALASAPAPGARAHEVDPTPGGGDCGTANYPSTFDAIQHIVLEGTYQCSNGLCHDNVAPQGSLDLTEGTSYLSLLGADGLGAPASGFPLKRVVPGEPAESLFYLKLLAKIDPSQVSVDVGAPMPSGGAPALTPEHLEAVRLWVRGGAPQTGVVDGTAELLGTCLPPSTPLKIPVPDPPAAGSGVQLRQTPWPLPGTASDQGEDEICMATYYDVSALVPDWAKVPCPDQFKAQKGCSNDPEQACSEDADCGAGNSCLVVRNANNSGDECFSYHREVLAQDPQSHHSIIQIYTGGASTDDAGWGDWTFKLEPTDPDPASRNGQPCDPGQVDGSGQNPGCSGGVVSSVACIGYGPADANNASLTGQGGNLVGFSGSQEPYYEQELADGVYNVAPLRGIVVWNSHAFNLTESDSTMAQYLNLDFAAESDQLYPAQGIFMSDWIFAQNVPPFGTQEICATYTIPQGARLFRLSSHTHVRGVGWRTWAPPNTPCQPGCPPGANAFVCQPDPLLPPCTGPRPEDPIYFSYDYSDPVQLDLDPPLAYDSPDPASRTFLFCSLYDNGSTPESPPVKRQSTAPEVPPVIFNGIPIQLPFVGGPCEDAELACVDGPNKGQPCGGDDGVCGGAGLCDACPAEGGVTTADEMFILLGTYFIPEPEGGALGATALGALAALAHARRTRIAAARGPAS